MGPLTRALPLVALVAIGCAGDEVSSVGSGSGGASGSGGESGGAASGGRATVATAGSGGKQILHDSGAAGSGGHVLEASSSDTDARSNDGTVPRDGGERDSGDADAAPPSKAGSIIVVSHATVAAFVFTNVVSAGFFDGPGNTYGRGCRRDVEGSCFVFECNFADGGAEAPAPGAAVSAGAITIGGSTPPFSLAYDAPSMKYATTPTVPVDRPIFTAGDTLTFTATGGVVPAFSASLVAPTPLMVTAPSLNTALSIERTKDLTFTWTGSSAGELSFNVRTVTTVSGTALASSLVSCQFLASAETGTIPNALLQKLPKTDATTMATLATDLSSTKELVTGDYSIHLAIGSAATTDDGKTQYATSLVTIL